MCARPLALQSGRTTRDLAKQLQFALRKQHERIANPFSRKRGMASNPIIGTIENAILQRKFVRIRDSVDCE
jgi:hypothetical protein